MGKRLRGEKRNLLALHNYGNRSPEMAVSGQKGKRGKEGPDGKKVSGQQVPKRLRYCGVRSKFQNQRTLTIIKRPTP